jgi:hypothetical protein
LFELFLELIKFFLGGDITSTPALDPSKCGQLNIKWAVCSASSCTYKSNVTFPTTCTGGPTLSNLLYACVDLISKDTQCPSGYTYTSVLNLCYRYVATPVVGTAAALDCASTGGVLMSASTTERNNFIVNTIGGGNTNIWIGLVWNKLVGKWIW